MKKDSLRKKKVIISGGGTGGHIFPAIAIANALKKLDTGISILFIGATGRMEMEKVPAAGYPIEGLPIAGWQRKRSIKNLLMPYKVIRSLIKVNQIINAFLPDVVVGVGGYASAPTLFAASLKGIPVLIQEQNSYAGITNKLLAPRAQKICVAYAGMEKYFPEKKIILTGNPVRQDLVHIQKSREQALSEWGLSTHKKTLLVIGGSLGARTINESILSGLERLGRDNIQVIWQTGKSFHSLARDASSSYNQVKVLDFITAMDTAYTAADVVIARAGALSISELCIVKKPAILVPSPNVAEDHQAKNAMALVSKQAALLIKDTEAKEKLVHEAIRLLQDGRQQQELSVHIAALALPDAAANIAKEVMTLIK